MEWASGLSVRTSMPSALAEVLAQVAKVNGPDLVLCFTSGGLNAQLGPLTDALSGTFRDACVMGAASHGVIGGSREIEGDPALSVVVARLPDVQLAPFVVHPDDAIWSADRWRGEVAAARGALLFSDPYSIDVMPWLGTLQNAWPGVPIVGGLGSAEARLEGPRFVLNGAHLNGGIVGLGWSGRVRFSSRVAQGCRPIGAPMFVTRSDGNHIFELDGRPAVDVLRELHEQLDPMDQALFGNSLFIGLQMRDQTEYAQGDFLIRNVVGVSKDPTALVIAAVPERFEVVQMHLRDARAAHEDLKSVLAPEASPRGALLVSCVGRGRGLFGESNHDSDQFAERFGTVPLGGVFANGEIGPVQGQPYVHGYTSVFALFEEE
ncbi:MAG: FIST N-terminal domain-containing protein [Myxococcota bacterium]